MNGPPDPPDGDELGWRLSTAVVMFHEAIAERLGLSAADHKALGIVSRAGSMTAGELAQRTGLSPGAVTGLVDRLVAAGYVERIRDAGDRRRVLIVPAQAGHVDLSEVFAGLSSAMHEMLAKYDEQQVQVIHDYVVGVIDVLHDQTRRLSER